MPTIKDIASRAGVSTSTVSHVINGTRFVSPEKRRLIEAVVAELAYNPNGIASSLRRKRTSTIGIIIPDISNFFFASVLKGLEQVLEKVGFSLILCNSAEDRVKEHKQVKLMAQKRVDGLVIAPAGAVEDYARLQRDFDGPIVFVDRYPANDLPFDAVLANNRSGARAAVEHLIDAGYSGIAIITGLPALSTSKERYRGYCEALHQRGIQLDQELVKHGNSRIDGGYRLAMELLSQQNRIKALFVANNLMTIGAYLAIKELHLRVPDDLAVMGFDDLDWAMITDPPLSVVHQPASEMGLNAGKLLLDRLAERANGDAVAPRRTVRLHTELILRESC